MAQEINSIEMLLYKELQDMYDMEKQLTKALPKMAKNAQSDELRTAIEEHLEVTNNQVSRLEQVFDLIGKPAKGKACAGMKGLIEEGKEAMEQDAEEPFSDAAIIAAAQRVEHYEIAAYGTARTLAEMLGNSEAAELLEESLNEEKETDERLTEICESLLQDSASSSEMEEEEEEEMESSRRQPERMVASSRASGARKSSSQQSRRRAS